MGNGRLDDLFWWRNGNISGSRVVYLYDRVDVQPRSSVVEKMNSLGIQSVALNPRLVVADEPVSALDVSVQAQVINLLQEIQENLNLTYLFVAHDLSVVRHIADEVAVMYVGKIVEMGDTEEIFNNPKHPYTSALLSSVPIPDPRGRQERIILEGEVANPANPPSGCYFHPRCSYATDQCKNESPQLEQIEPGRWVSCHRASELDLAGLSAKSNGTS